MSFQYGRNLNKSIRIEDGVAFFPVAGREGEGDLVVKPDKSALEFLSDFASEDGADELLKRLLPFWFVRKQAEIKDLKTVCWVSRHDLEEAETSLN